MQKQEPKIWFTSDWHFYHDKILDFHPKRLEIFGNDRSKVVEKMIVYWNNRVAKIDTVYVLGDLSFGSVEEKRKLFSRLNGNKVLILGNHDKIATEQERFFNHITQIKNMKFKKSIHTCLSENLEIIMCHFPLSEWEHVERGSIHLHGHCHGKQDLVNSVLSTKVGRVSIDVGIDSSFANYDFVSLEKIANYLNKIKK